jgi:hypothetical protein
VYRALEGQSISCVPRTVFSFNTCVPVVSHAAGVKIEPVKVAKVIRSEKGKNHLVIEGFKFRLQKILADDMERWCCTNKKCKCHIKCNDSREILGGNVMQTVKPA